MVTIIIKSKIATELNNVATHIPAGTCIPLRLHNGDFSFDTTANNKMYWDSLKESQQNSIIRRYARGKRGLEDIIEEEMNK